MVQVPGGNRDNGMAEQSCLLCGQKAQKEEDVWAPGFLLRACLGDQRVARKLPLPSSGPLGPNLGRIFTVQIMVLGFLPELPELVCFVPGTE